MSAPDELTLCELFPDIATASIAYGALDAEGIPAVIDNEMMGTILPPAGAVRLMVFRRDLARARAIVKGIR